MKEVSFHFINGQVLNYKINISDEDFLEWKEKIIKSFKNDEEGYIEIRDSEKNAIIRSSDVIAIQY